MKRTVLILLIITTTLLASCSKESPFERTYGELIAVTDSAAYTPKEYVAAVSEWTEFKRMFANETARQAIGKVIGLISSRQRYYLDTVFAHREQTPMLLYKRSWQIETYTFTYRSLSSLGEPITLSGRVTFPTAIDGSGNKVSTLSLVAHYMALKDEMPSLSLSPYSMRSFFNSAVIEPDYQGYGVAEGTHYPGFSFYTLGRQSIDCIMAALEIMAAHGVTLADDGYTTAWGFSASTPIVVGMARYYDEHLSAHEQSLIRLRSIFGGSGPMLLDQMIYHIDKTEGYPANCISYFIPFFNALPQHTLEGYTLDQFVPQWMHTYRLTVEGKEMTFYEAKINDVYIIPLYPDDHDFNLMRDQLAEDMLLPDEHINFDSPKMKTIMNTLRRLSYWGEWLPSADIYLTHCAADRYIPYSQGYNFYLSKKASGTMHWKQANDPITTDLIGSVHEAGGVESTIFTILCREPEQAFNRTPGRIEE